MMSKKTASADENIRERRIKDPIKHLRWIFFAKKVHGLTNSAKSSIIDVC